MGPYVGSDYNLTLSTLQSRLQHIYHGQPYARVDFIPQSGTLDLASALGTSGLVLFRYKYSFKIAALVAHLER
jgi:hypothetical protein